MALLGSPQKEQQPAKYHVVIILFLFREKGQQKVYFSNSSWRENVYNARVIEGGEGGRKRVLPVLVVRLEDQILYHREFTSSCRLSIFAGQREVRWVSRSSFCDPGLTFDPMVDDYKSRLL